MSDLYLSYVKKFDVSGVGVVISFKKGTWHRPSDFLDEEAPPLLNVSRKTKSKVLALNL